MIWIIGEYRDQVGKYGPDALRKLLKGFTKEKSQVKLQILNLAVKLFLANSKEVGKLFKYALNLCKFDVDYDLRDRSRLVRAVFLASKSDVPTEGRKLLRLAMQKMFLASKPTPVIVSPFAD